MLMRREYFDRIRSGRKTTTLRFWKRPQARAGSIHTIGDLGRLLIRSVDVIDRADLTEADAVADGFDCLADLQAALAEFCNVPDAAERTFYRVEFEFLGE